MAKHPAKCPKCGEPLEVDTAVGGSVTCPKCRASLTIAGKGAPVAKADPLIGKTLGEFEVIELLGRGGMGAVYKGRQPALDRLVAVKTLPRSLAMNADFVARFHREARTAANLRHTNLVQVYAVGQAEGIHYIVMELVDGEGLNDVLKREGPLAPDRALELLKQTCAGLAVAHEAGIVHRDIKPSNLMIDAKGQVRITDFGLAKRTEGDVSVTQTGQSLGTPLYMAPEMAKGEEADARSDLYSLGAAFYHLLAGQPPFQGRTPAELIVKHATETPRPLGELAPHIDRRLTAIIDRLLRKNPASRYPSAGALLEELEALGRLSAGARPAPRAGKVADVRAPTATLSPGKRMERQFAAEERQQHRQAARKRTTLIAAVASIALLVVIGLIVWIVTRGGDQPDRDRARVVKPPTSSRVVFDKPDPRELGAESLFTNASKAAALGKWRAAAAHLARLDKDYASTKYHAAHRSAIAALRKKLDAKLKPPTKPDTKQPPQPEPEGDWVSLFDGKTLGGWRVVDEGQFAGHGEVLADAGKLVLGKGRGLTGIRWTQAFPVVDYEIAMDAMHVAGPSRLCRVVFPVGTSRCVFAFGSFSGTEGGLSRVDGNDMKLGKRVSIESGRWYPVRLRVTATEISAWIDDRKVVAFSTAHRNLSVHEDYAAITPFGLVSTASGVALRNIRYRRLEPEPAAAPRFFHGALRRMADGRVELRYDWSDPGQLRDWRPRPGSKFAIVNGELQFDARAPESSSLLHHARFAGDVEIDATWRILEGDEVGDCGISFCRDWPRHYSIGIRRGRQRLFKRPSDQTLKWSNVSYAVGQRHRARIVRSGTSITVWINGRRQIDAADGEYTNGSVAFGAYRAKGAFDDLRFVGKLDPAWLAQHPDAAKQVAAAPLARGEAREAVEPQQQPRVGQPGAAAREELLVDLKPLWAKRDYAGALEAAKKAVAEAKDDAAKEAVRPCAKAAELLVRFWKGVHEGAEKLKGKPFRVRGMKATIAGVKGDTLVLAMGPAQTGRKLSTLEQDELLTLARAGLDADDGEARLALGLFLLFDAKPDVAAANAEFAAAKKAGADAADVPGLADAATAPAFDKALAVAEAKLEAGDFGTAAKAIARARELRPDSKQPGELLDRAFVRVMTQCLACSRSADFAKAKSLLRSAHELRPKDPDVTTLADWLKTAAKPVFADTFDGLKLDDWEAEVGTWKPLNGKLCCTIGSHLDGRLVLKRTSPKDFVLTFDVSNEADVGFKFGAVFRYVPKRILYFLLSAQFKSFGIGAGGGSRWDYGPKDPVDGVNSEFVGIRNPFNIETKRTYRVAIRCLDDNIECYLDGVLAMRVSDAKPASGKIGFYARRGDFRFDNVRLYRAVPLPKLEFTPADR